MQLEDAIKSRIMCLLKKKGYTSLWELYKNSGVPKSTINGLFSTNIHSLPRLSTLLHICKGLDTNLKDFFHDEIFINVEDNMEDKKECT